MTPYRRYEILLPRRFNDGVRVPKHLLEQTSFELEQRFGAVSAETHVVRGRWQSEGQTYEDELVRIFVDVPDTPEHEQFFREFKEALKQRFQQREIWITSHDIRVL